VVPDGVIAVSVVSVTAIISAWMLSYSNTPGRTYQTVTKKTLLLIIFVASNPVPDIVTVSPICGRDGARKVRVGEACGGEINKELMPVFEKAFVHMLNTKSIEKKCLNPERPLISSIERKFTKEGR
jgi:hypothetical protein